MKGNLLIVDDEKYITEMLSILLEKIAEKIYVAEDGIKALEILENNIIHAVISDIRMPQMDGIQFIQKARENDCKAPFIFFSAHGDDKEMIEVTKYGVFDFIKKPQMNNLEKVTENALDFGYNIINNNKVNPELSKQIIQKAFDSLDVKKTLSEDIDDSFKLKREISIIEDFIHELDNVSAQPLTELILLNKLKVGIQSHKISLTESFDNLPEKIKKDFESFETSLEELILETKRTRSIDITKKQSMINSIKQIFSTEDYIKLIQKK